MCSIAAAAKPHAVCIPYPAQGHINPMLILAKLLHHKGFYITYVHTEYNHNRLLRTRGPHALDGVPGFRFETIPDGLPRSDADATQDVPSLSQSTSNTCLAPFRDLLHRLNNSLDVPPITCIVADGIMSFTLDAAEELGVPEVLFWTTSACGFLGYMHYPLLVEKGFTPAKDPSYLSNGYLDTIIDWIPGMKNIRLKDLPSFIRTTDPNDIMLNFAKSEAQRASRAYAVVLNTFDAFEQAVLDNLTTMLPRVYCVGPLHLLEDQISDGGLKTICSSLWKEQPECNEWLDGKEPNSVVYVNFGSVTVMTTQQLTEFAWGLANSQKPFLWIIRPDLVAGNSAALPQEFVAETKERGLLAGWCSQKEILKHPSVGGFLTHSGWNSTLESVCGGVALICWPFFAEQQTNCRFSCTEWGIGMEIDNNVKREEVEKLVRELMDGEKGKEMKNMAVKWKRKGNEAAAPGGPSNVNLDKLVGELLETNKKM